MKTNVLFALSVIFSLILGKGIPAPNDLSNAVLTNPSAAIDSSTGRVVRLDHRVTFSRLNSSSCEPDSFIQFSNPSKTSAIVNCRFIYTEQPVTFRFDIYGPFTHASVESRELTSETYQVNKYASSLMGYSNWYLETEDFDYNTGSIVLTVAVPVDSTVIRASDLEQLPETFHVTFSNIKTERATSLVGATATNMYYGQSGDATVIVFELNMGEGDNQFSALQTRNPETINGIQQLTAGDTSNFSIILTTLVLSILGSLVSISALLCAIVTFRRQRDDELEDVAREDRLRRRLDTLESNVSQTGTILSSLPAGSKVGGEQQISKRNKDVIANSGIVV